MKRLLSLSGIGLVKVSEAKNRRALRNNDKEIRPDSKRPEMNSANECENSYKINWIRRRTRTFSITNGT